MTSQGDRQGTGTDKSAGRIRAKTRASRPQARPGPTRQGKGAAREIKIRGMNTSGTEGGYRHNNYTYLRVGILSYWDRVGDNMPGLAIGKGTG